jgi:hypothetical protein
MMVLSGTGAVASWIVAFSRDATAAYMGVLFCMSLQYFLDAFDNRAKKGISDVNQL